ncbi:DUF418 domain-containing protein [Nocardia sp. NPDC127526]|uniref:DUF418 domain-containing protein n=1 Tax=Nocardia sp. NPDC127526 TaxID=3345393 RepID=UPI003633E518
MSAEVESASGIGAGKRIGEVDTLRGFALFGILITNALVLTMLMSFVGAGGEVRPTFDGGIDRFVYAVMYGLFLGRFYLLFAFLFGYSFTLQIAAAERAGAAPVRRLLRRAGALFVIGIAHAMLLWIGDILTLYAVLCVILVLLRKLRPRTAVISALVLYALFCGLAFLPGGTGGIEGFGEFFDLRRMHEGYTGGFGDTFETQLGLAPGFLLFIFVGQGLPSLGMFLLGMAAGKRRVFEDPDLLRRWTPRAMAVGFGVGLPVSIATIVLWTFGADVPSYWSGIQELANPFMTLGYVATIGWLTRSRWAGAVAWLAPAGRMAASNYIAQSVIFMVVYTGYGLALADRVPPAAVVALGVVTFAVQLRVSAWWLDRFAYGPVEWVLRAVTYRSVPPWRKASA